jgi:hypothetical protein
MSKKMRWILLIVLNLAYGQAGKAQANLDSAFLWVFPKIEAYYGNVFLDTSYKKMDTAQLRKGYKYELHEALELIKTYRMKLADFSFKNLSSLYNKVIGIDDFYKTRPRWRTYSEADSIAIAKYDELQNINFDAETERKQLDSIRQAQSMLFKSAFHQQRSSDASRSIPKRMTVLRVFEGETMYLIVYHFMMRFSYAHYYPKSELIFK